MDIAEETTKSWFVVFNNPQEHGYTGTPQEICERLKAEWCVDDTRTGAWCYCVKHYVGHYPYYDDDGKFVCYRLASTPEEKEKIPPDLHHVHMVLEDTTTMRFSKVKNTYAIGAHFEGTKGTKKEAEDYISKTGEYDEKPKREAGLPWEEIIYFTQHGTIKGRQGQRSDIDNVGAMIREGKTPAEIMSTDFRYYRYQTMVRQAFFDKRSRETPEYRELTVIWHLGESGTGKSYWRLKLLEEKGADDVYFVTDYRAPWDGYNGQRYLWIEDFKGEFRFGDLLRYLDHYKVELHARFTNAKALWTEVHITSVLHPLEAYRRMLSKEQQDSDKADQLLRRITLIRYHYKEGDQYLWEDFEPSTPKETMRRSVIGYPDEEDKGLVKSPWHTVENEGELPF